jgi:3-oxoacyl-[acyl-carrier protein] reductase
MKTILISGTSSGIGHDLCVQALKLNLNVISISRNIDPTLSLPGVVSYSIDITKKEQIDELKKDLERKKVKIDILVNNAGFLKKELFQDSSIDSFRNTYNVNVFGLAELTRQLLPLINKSGHVVNISSIGGVNGSKKFPGLSIYSSSKSAVIGLTEVLAEEFPSGPSFNVLALGSVNTKMLNEAFPDYKAQTDSNEMAEYILDFALNGNKLFNGKLISVSKTNP